MRGRWRLAGATTAALLCLAALSYQVEQGVCFGNCSAGTFSTPDKPVCTNCSLGTFSSTGGATVCTTCSSGTFAGMVGSTSCTTCSVGTYSDQSGASACTSCAVGAFASGPGSSVCESCSAGSYASTTGSSTCTSCSAGTFSSVSAASTCTDCVPGKYAPTAGATTCATCSAGTFSAVSRATTCTNCSLGTYSASAGASTCLSCGVGTYSDRGGATACANCAIGTYADKTGQASCTSCPVGGFSDVSGASTCSSCSPGKFSATTGASTCETCTAGAFSPVSGSSTCTNCSLGTYSPSSGSSSCIACAVGTHSDQGGARACANCAIGTYADKTGQASCTSCPTGSFSDASGASTCSSCSPGRFSATTGASTCETCTAGTFSPVSGSSICTNCSLGTYSPFAGASTCLSCGVGTYADRSAATACTNCVPGTFAAKPGESSCTSCSPGSFSPAAGASTCTSCAPGEFASSSGATTCATCSAGTFSKGAAAECTDCPLGTFSRDGGASSCTFCGVGEYADHTRATACSSCPAGSYSDVTGTAQCTACAAGNFSAVSGASTCSACGVGTFSSDPGATSCASCGVGQYTDQTGATACSMCPAGSYSERTGAAQCTACPSGFTSQPGLDTCIALVSGANPSVVGQWVIFTATVSSATGPPAGTVRFDVAENSSPPRSLIPSAANQSSASWVAVNLDVGTVDVSATYLRGSTANDASLAQTIVPATVEPPTVALAPSENPALASTTLTLTATVSSSLGTPRGVVFFYRSEGNPLTFLGSAPTADAGPNTSEARLTVSDLSPGDHQLHANFVLDSLVPSDAGANASIAATAARTASIVQSILTERPATMVSVVSSDNPSLLQQPVTFTATVSSTRYAPAGSVAFRDGALVIGNASLSAFAATSAQGSFTTAALGLGNHSITAEYLPTSIHTGNVSPELLQGVLPPRPPFLSLLTFTSAPTAGGTPLTLTGSNFGSGPVTVTVGGRNCSVTGHTDTEATCTLPAGEGLGVSVILVAGGQFSNALSLSYDPPVLDPITASAPTSGGTALTLTGSNFGLTPTVVVGGRNCPVTVHTHTQAVCMLPEGQGKDLEVLLTAGGQFSNIQLFSYAAPSVTSVSPSSGPTEGGILLTIRGSSFGTSPTASVGANDCPVETHSHTEVACRLPAGVGTNLAVEVEAAGQTSNASVRFSYAPPVVTAIDPTQGPAGTHVTITGHNFGATGGTALIGALPCGSLVHDAQRPHEVVSCDAPPGSGLQPVQFVTGGQQGGGASFLFAAPTTTSLASSSSPSVLGEYVTFTATVSSAGGTPTGFVRFQFPEGASPLRPLSLIGNVSQASWVATNLSAGTLPVSAVYVPSSTFTESVGNLSQTVLSVAGAAVTTTTLSADPNPALPSQMVTLTATVSSATGKPSGSVSLYGSDGGVLSLLEVAVLNGSTARFTPLNLSLGRFDFHANFVPTTTGNVSPVAASTGLLTQVVVSEQPTATALTSAPNPSFAGDPAVFTAEVSSASLAPTGMVRFFEGATELGSAPLSGTGNLSRAAITTSTLALGDHSVVARYEGSGPFTPSVSNEHVHGVTCSLMSLTPAALPGGVVGVAYSGGVSAVGGRPPYVYEVDPGRPLPPGLRLEASTGKLLGTPTTAGTFGFALVVTDAFRCIWGQQYSIVVTLPATKTALGSSSNPSERGEYVTLTATVSATAGTPSGTVQFTLPDGTTPAVPLAADAGNVATASWVAANLSVGTHGITAQFTSDGAHEDSAGALVQKVQDTRTAETTIVVGSSANPSLVSDPVTITASVASTAGAASGVVSFYGVEKAGVRHLLESDAIGANTSTAALHLGNLSLGAHPLEANFVGDPPHRAVTGALTQHVMTALPAFSVDNVKLGEGDSGTTAFAFTVSLEPPSPLTATVSYATRDGSARAPVDYQATSGTLTFPPGVTQQKVVVSVQGDTLDEDDEDFTLALSDPTGAVVGKDTGIGLILNDDPAAGLAIDDVSVTEGDTGTHDAVFTVQLKPASGRRIVAGFTTVDGTATSPADYLARAGTLTFLPGETVKTIGVPVVGDTTPENNVAFAVVLGPANTTLVKALGQGTILDDDSKGKARPQPTWHEAFPDDDSAVLRLGDFNGDGRADIASFDTKRSAARIALSEGVRFGPASLWSDQLPSAVDGRVVIGDFDGDGRDDVAVVDGDKKRDVVAALSAGGGFLPPSVWLRSSGQKGDVFEAGDVNGDGRDDLVIFAGTKAGEVLVALSTGAGFAAPVEWHRGFTTSADARVLVGDWNGDGKADIARLVKDPVDGTRDLFVALSNGAGFAAAAKWADWIAIGAADIPRAGDLNADRRSDLFTFLASPDGRAFRGLSAGNALKPAVAWPEKVLVESKDQVFVGDVNGDGRADVVVFAVKDKKVYVSLAR